MKLKIILQAKEFFALPINYNHMLQNKILELLNKKNSNFLHNEGYKVKWKSFKLFNFSSLEVEKKKICKNKIFVYPGKVILGISSADENFIFDFIDGIITNKGIDFKEGKLDLVSIFSSKELNGNKLVVFAKTPIVVTKPYSEKAIDFFTPRDAEYLASIEKNLKDKYEAFYNKKYDKELEIEIMDESKVYKKIRKYKKWVYEGYIMGVILNGNNDILNLAYKTGLGSKNAQGFGFVETFSSLNSLKNYIKVV
ncbi:CRISPR-associated endoribonuclease Cas6 [Crassaminicella thermophila]|uniref:CRISPR-associated endoribonuclease n=1 Tax=Crassaminicella thermophila TaxID=2599308 RepID=A0A5C0SDZ1_CRATE|nr:CRISPR-associated endoribonuclease Cas6 [Crassaminicella thermophila]QEK11538.1 CRISPR-associated endoribonuclease Cas6 [Crassaminicella thermophila]